MYNMLSLLFSPCLAWQPAVRPRGVLAPQAAARRTAAVQLQFGGGGLPAKIEALLEPTVDRKATVPMWKAFRQVYRSEAEAIAAAEKNVIPILSFINTESNIRENWKVLQEKFPKDEAYDIVTKNPGILANKAGDLRSSSAGEIRSSMQFVTAFDDVPKEIRTLIPPATAILIVTSIATRLYQCQGGVCG